ncbi:class F sortase [Nakamurella alba]|uniref:class F sortase n=1 Tax=Nakamurella alba TaxID=2665158 RepID=UPI002AC35F94|nr:class F sortase [Nakamurella alba]
MSVPSIGIDEQLIDLGIAADGTAQTPEDYSRAGWFATGGRPGQFGLPTVILGHVDSLDGPAVFFRLRDTAVGDSVAVGLQDGRTATYTVTAVDRYPKDDFPTFAVYGATPTDTLRLVTCGGEFDRAAGSYLDNIVVTAVRA